MAEKEDIFSSKVSYAGIFSFKDFYSFCYQWLTDETGLGISEDKYKEKLAGDSKEIEIAWTGTKKVTDYFKYEVSINFSIKGLKEVEIAEGNARVKSNQGSVTLGVKGTLVRDYDGKFEKSSFQKFLRSIYDKWVIPSRVQEYEDKLIGKCNDFLNQAKAYLDLEGKQ